VKGHNNRLGLEFYKKNSHIYKTTNIGMRDDNVWNEMTFGKGTAFHVDFINQDMPDVERLWNTFILEESQGLLRQASERLNDSILTYTWATVGVGLFYRSPSQSAVLRDQYFSTMDDNISKILKLNYDLVVFGGDFNVRSNYFWKDDINTPEGNRLYDLSVKHSLLQCIDQPTRITPMSRSCLDLIFYNSPGYILNYAIDALISLSDNCVTSVSVDFECSVPSNPVTKRIWRFSRVNEGDLNSAIVNHDWDSIFDLGNPDVVCDNFAKMLT
jgi:hypothetical protein